MSSQRSMVECQRALAVGKATKSDHTDQIIGPAREPAGTRSRHEFLNDVLHRVQPADIPARELKVEGLHRAGNVEHDLDGDPLTADP